MSFTIFACSSNYPNISTATVLPSDYNGDTFIMPPSTEIIITSLNETYNVQFKTQGIDPIIFNIDFNTRNFGDSTFTLLIGVLDDFLPSEICNQPIDNSFRFKIIINRRDLPNLVLFDTFFITTGKRKSDGQQIASVEIRRRKSPELNFTT